MAPTRTGLFPVYVDPPAQSSSSSLTAACSKLSLRSSPARPRRTADTRPATTVLADKALPTKENQPLCAVPAALGKTKKPPTGLGVGSRKAGREALRDVSQEFECRGSEPAGFREITPPPVVAAGAPPAKALSIFVDPSPSAASSSSSTGSRAPSSMPALGMSSARPRTLTVYTSPPRKVTVVQPSSITGTVKRGRGLGGAPGLGGLNVGRGLRA